MPNLTTLEQTRLLIGDSDQTNQLLTDDEVNQQLTNNTITTDGVNSVNILRAAADCAGAIAAKYARGFNFGEDRQTFNLSERVEHYERLEETLRRRSGGASVPLSIPGTTPIT